MLVCHWQDFLTKYPVVGYDINKKEGIELMNGVDSTLEVDDDILKSVLVSENSDSIGLFCTDKLEKLSTVITIYYCTNSS